MLKRAYSQLEVKSVDDEKRELTGIATTPSTDSYGDVVEPKGGEFKLPIPFLWQHDSGQPIGHVTKAKVTNAGIEVSVKLVRTDEPGTLKDRLDEAWQSIKLGLVRGLSIGFKPLEHNYLENGKGVHFLRWAWMELSAVTIPANSDASVTAIRSVDSALLAASGTQQRRVVSLKPAGVSAPASKGNSMNIQEQISSFESKRAASAARLNAISEKAAGESRGKDGAEKEEFDNLAAEIETIDGELKDLKALERINVAQAKPVAQKQGSNPDGAMNLRDPRSIVVLEKKLPPGVGFARLVGCIAAGKGDIYRSMQFAKQKFRDETRLHGVIDLYSRMTGHEMVQRATIDVGTSVDSDFAAPLVYAQQLSQEFIDFLRPSTILGRLPGLRTVPFNTRVPRQTGGGTANWVGEGAPKPLTQQAFDTVSLAYMKLAVITVITEELARFSSPAAELIIRDDLAKAVQYEMDWAFVDPDNAGTANVKPASISNGVTPITTAGTSEANIRTDLRTLLATFATNNLGVKDLVLIMPTSTALALSVMVNTLGQPSFPNITLEGGSLLGIPVVTSENPGMTDSSANGKLVLAVNTKDILVADDGQVTVDVSREASVQMDSAPTNPITNSTVLESLWQRNLIGIKAERYITWAKARSTAVSWVASVNWGE
jgi:HK97 family phage major capsid protein/HK97 family phage prohead protease